MTVVLRIAVGILLLAHGLVHLLYLAPDVREFSIDRSWIVPEAVRRPLAVSLMVATVAAFAFLALAVWGVPGLSAAWPLLTVVACALSAVLLLAFWDNRLALGLAIDVALVVIAVATPRWATDLIR
jgi:multidrug transporter EmrE-like cation transporter